MKPIELNSKHVKGKKGFYFWRFVLALVGMVTAPFGLIAIVVGSTRLYQNAIAQGHITPANGWVFDVMATLSGLFLLWGVIKVVIRQAKG